MMGDEPTTASDTAQLKPDDPGANALDDSVSIGERGVAIRGDVTDSVIITGDITLRQKITNLFLRSTEQQRALRNRQAMLELVKNTWIKGVLEQSLHGAAMIELGMEERTDAVEKPWDMVVQMPERLDRTLAPGTRIMDVFDQMNGTLLILGEPGSGKTTMLLELARDTIGRAEQDPMQPIPVIFNLASWAEKERPISAWLVDELNTKYSIPRNLAGPWIKNDDLLLLLDGLDEVKAERRDVCVRAINDLRQKHLVPLVVCSRIADYEELTTKLKLRGAVLLQPLTPQQVDRYLAGAGTELRAVSATLKNDCMLQGLAQSPLMLSIMTLAYRGMPIEYLRALDTTDARRRHLFGTYAQRMFSRRGVDESYSPTQTINWLTRLAQRMSEHSLSIFLIEQMQPDWLQTLTRRYLHSIISCMIAGLIAGLIGTLVYAPTVGLVLGLLAGLIFALAFGRGDITPVERLIWPTGRYRVTFGMVLWFLGAASFFYLIPRSVGLSGYMISLFIFGASLIFLASLLWKREKLVRSVMAILGAVAWMLGLLFLPAVHTIHGSQAMLVWFNSTIILYYILLLGVFSSALRSESIEEKNRPNQGVLRSGRNAVAVGVILVLLNVPILLLYDYLGVELGESDLQRRWVLLTMAIIGVFVAMRFGGAAYIKHYVLRLLLTLRGHVPWSYAEFLDICVDRIFLRKVGGGYIFIHRLLQDYFASLTEDDVERLVEQK